MYTFIQPVYTKLNKSDSKVSIKESPKYKMIKRLNSSLYVCMYVFIYLFIYFTPPITKVHSQD